MTGLRKQGFGLQIGSEIFLVMNVPYRHRLEKLSDDISGTVTMLASFLIDNSTIGNGQASMGIYQFTDTALGIRKYVVNGGSPFFHLPLDPRAKNSYLSGCYRPANIAWYLQPAPFWAQFVIVSPLSPLYPRWRISNHTEARKMLSVSLFVIAVISSAAFGINKIANHFIFNRSDIVSAIGAFTAGILGNLYSRKMGGTAFTSMVTGVLFLVPVRHFCFFSAFFTLLTVCLCLSVWSLGGRGDNS